MNTENHKIQKKSPVLLRFTVQMPATENNIAAMEDLKGHALMMEWDEVAPFSVIKQEALCISSAYVAERPAPPEPEPKPVEWHNPDNLTPEQIGEGYRLLAVGEGVPAGAEIYIAYPPVWERAQRSVGSPPAAGWTYRTNLPYHPAK